MIFIKRFLDKMTAYEGKQSKDIIIPLSDARGLRDDIAKLLLDLNEKKNNSEEVVKININGGSFK
jgi:hypothetical protein